MVSGLLTKLSLEYLEEHPKLLLGVLIVGFLIVVGVPVAGFIMERRPIFLILAIFMALIDIGAIWGTVKRIKSGEYDC